MPLLPFWLNDKKRIEEFDTVKWLLGYAIGEQVEYNGVSYKAYAEIFCRL